MAVDFFISAQRKCLEKGLATRGDSLKVDIWHLTPGSCIWELVALIPYFGSKWSNWSVCKAALPRLSPAFYRQWEDSVQKKAGTYRLPSALKKVTARLC